MTGLVLVYAGEVVPEEFSASIMLLGPGPYNGYSWKTYEIVPLLVAAGFEGVVIIPEPRPDESGVTPWFDTDYDDILEEEYFKFQLADVLLAWVPRTRENPAINTNYQLGKGMDSGKVVFGAPDGAWKTRYLRHWAEKLVVPVASTPEETVAYALHMLGEGALRQGGERFVPPYVWNTRHFQQWYSFLLQADNRLDHAEVVWSWRVGPRRRITFFWILHVRIWIESEGRYKDNEVVLSRPDVSSIVLYQRAANLDDSLIVLVKEFRSPVANETGYVWENAGGSSWKEGVDPLQRASEECGEETGLVVGHERFRYHGVRQIAPTLSAHLAHLFSVELSSEEIARVAAEADVPRGVAEDTERTYATVATLGDIRRSNVVGWGDLGMILEVLLS